MTRGHVLAGAMGGLVMFGIILGLLHLEEWLRQKAAAALREQRERLERRMVEGRE